MFAFPPSPFPRKGVTIVQLCDAKLPPLFWQQRFWPLLGCFVGRDDARNERVANDILRQEFGEGDAAHILEDLARLDKAALLAFLQIDLRDVPGDHATRAYAHAREEHLHLLG